MNKYTKSPSRRELFRAIAGTSVLYDGTTTASSADSSSPLAVIRWKFGSEGREEKRLHAVSDAVAYVGANGGTFYAVSTEDGDTLWAVSTDSDGDIELVTVLGTTAYLESSEGIHAVDARTGERKWTFDRSGPSYVTDDSLYVADEAVHAVDRVDGNTRWRFECNPPPSWVVVRGETAIAGTEGGSLYGVDVSDGSVRFRFEGDFGPTRPVASPTRRTESTRPTLEKTVVVEDESTRELCGMSVPEGTKRWQLTLGGPYRITTDDERVYVVSESGIRAVSVATGTTQWHRTPSDRLTWAAVDDSSVYVGGVGSVHAVSKADGSPEWSTSVGDAAIFPGRPGRRFLPVYDSDSNVWGIEIGTGATRWRFEIDSSPVWYARSVKETTFVSDASGTVYALSPPSPTTGYDFSLLGWVAGGLFSSALAIGTYRRYARRRTSSDVPEPQTFEDFEILNSITSDDYSRTYAARTPDGTPVALERFTTSDISTETFVDAIETWTSLEHEPVLDVLAWDTDPVPWVATERWDDTLAERADELSSEEIAHVVADAAEAVHCLHRNGVSHGGLTPEVILFVDGDLRVANWRLESELRGPYGESDTYRLAALAEELLRDRQRTEELNEVLSRALADDPDERYDSALQFADALRWAVRE